MAMEKPGKPGSSETIVVTGGAGYMGQHIVRQLLEQNIFPLREIRIFDIQELKWFPGMEPYRNPNNADLKLIKGDICHMDEIRGACRDATAVIHTAAHVDVSSLQDGKKMQLVNLKGTENVIQACVDNNIERLVYTSSVDAFLTPKPFSAPNVTEDQVPTPNKFLLGSYGSTKNQADKLVIQANNTLLQNGRRLLTCSLRIPYMYGEGDEKGRDMLELAAKYKKFYPLGHDDHVVQKIYAGNAAWAHVLAVHQLTNPDPDYSPAGKSMFVGDDTPLQPFSAHFQPFVDKLGAKNSFRISFRVLYAVGACVDFISWILQPVYCLRSSMTKWTFVFCGNNYSVNWKMARKCLGYSPLYSYAQSIDRNWVYYKESFNVQ